VYKDTIFCAIYDGKLYSNVKEYESMNNSVFALGEDLQREGVNQVAMENTSIYWMPITVYFAVVLAVLSAGKGWKIVSQIPHPLAIWQDILQSNLRG